MEKYVGKPLSFLSPSGKEIIIREQNGEDDATLSAMSSFGEDETKGEEKISNYNEFVKDIILSIDGKAFPTIKDIEALPLRDKYYIMLKSRIHSNGPIVKFEIECQKCKATTIHEDDLNRFDTDLREGNNPDKPYAIELYPSKENPIERTLSSGRKIKFKLMDGHSEKLILQLGKTSVNINTELIARELALEDNGKFVVPSVYNVFAPIEMREIRKLKTELDEQFSLITECKCENCNDVRLIPLTVIPDFFYPSEI